MPLQNRVQPDGDIVAIRARGTMMGNRGGRIHDPDTRLLLNRRWASKAWICCVTEFKNRHRPVMGRSYTELFFLDEVTALAAGHRPCFECRRADALRFAECFSAARGVSDRARAAEMDDILHVQRLAPPKPVDADEILASYPDGTMFALSEEDGDRRFLALRSAAFLEWASVGYRPASTPQGMLDVLTPAAVVDTLHAGYRPRWHASGQASAPAIPV